MRRIAKVIFTGLLLVSLILMGPLPAFAEPVQALPAPPADIPYYFTPIDLTPSLEAAVGIRGLSEVTAVAMLEEIYVGALDNSGNPMLWSYSGGDPAWTDRSFCLTNMQRINDIGIYEDGLGTYICLGGVGGASGANGVSSSGVSGIPTATLTLFQVGSLDVDTYYIAGRSAITSLCYNPISADLGMTVAPSGFATFDSGDGVLEQGDVMAAAANSVSWPSANGPYFLVGTHSGTVLEYGAGYGDVFTTLPGATDILDLGNSFGMNYGLATAMGTAGTAKLFKMVAEDDVTELNLPPTMTKNALISTFFPYNLIGGTGNGAHLYKWRQVSGEFIDFDYMLTGMTEVKGMSSIFDMLVLTGGEPKSLDIRGPNNIVSEGVWVVVGSGAKKIVLVVAEPLSQKYDTAVDNLISSAAGGASVNVPAGAVASGGGTLDMIIEKLAPGSVPAAPSGFKFLGTSYDFQCFANDGGAVTEFNPPVTITFTYNDADLNGLDEDSLRIYWYNVVSGAWEVVAPYSVDKVNNTLTVQVSHFSQFGIIGLDHLLNTGS